MKTLYAKAIWSASQRTSNPATPLVTPELAMAMATSNRYFGWWLPTETVVYSPKQVIPDQACYYSLNPEQTRSIMGWTPDEFPNRLERKSEDGRVTYNYINSMYLVERHSDCGDDGHTHYRLVGYALLTPADFDTYLAYEKACSERTSRYDPTIEEVIIEGPTTYCYSCSTASPTTSWVGDTPSSYPRCPNCTMC